MTNASARHIWEGSDAYEAYMGRWSRPLARAYLPWFGAPKSSRWLDVGCGTGALTEAVLSTEEPTDVLGIDPSPEFVGHALSHVSDPRARFEVGDARQLPVSSDSYDAVVAGLVLNHLSGTATAIAEMVRAARPRGMVGAYVWDYSGEMQLIRYFWEAVAATDADAATHDPRSGYHICQPDPLAAEFRAAGLTDVEVRPIDITMTFRDFDDYWLPHVMVGPSAAQRYLRSLGDDRQLALRERLRSVLPATDGSIQLIARAWAVRGAK
jgi:ubiquinone/menaquinone biosynthesis C-methylase UbiE